MCRNIRVLYNFDPPATETEIHEAATQFVRKVSGYAKPSEANQVAFERAIQDVTDATRQLLSSLVTNSPSRNREVEQHKAHERGLKRFG